MALGGWGSFESVMYGNLGWEFANVNILFRLHLLCKYLCYPLGLPPQLSWDQKQSHAHLHYNPRQTFYVAQLRITVRVCII